jgi:hypothetical protein
MIRYVSWWHHVGKLEHHGAAHATHPLLRQLRQPGIGLHHLRPQVPLDRRAAADPSDPCRHHSPHRPPHQRQHERRYPNHHPGWQGGRPRPVFLLQRRQGRCEAAATGARHGAYLRAHHGWQPQTSVVLRAGVAQPAHPPARPAGWLAGLWALGFPGCARARALSLSLPLWVRAPPRLQPPQQTC